MRINRRDASIDDFEMGYRNARAQHHFEIPGKAVSGLGIPLRGGLPDDEDSKCSGSFLGRNGEGRGKPKSARRKELPRESIVLAESALTDDLARHGEVAGISIVEHA